MSGIRIEKTADRFVRLPLEAVRSTMKYRTVGILAWLLSHEDGYTVSTADLYDQDGREGREAIRAALVELREAGYLEQRRVQGAGGLWRTETFVTDSPKYGFPDVGQPDAGFPDAKEKSREKNKEKNSNAAVSHAHASTREASGGGGVVGIVSLADQLVAARPSDLGEQVGLVEARVGTLTSSQRTLVQQALMDTPQHVAALADEAASKTAPAGWFVAALRRGAHLELAVRGAQPAKQRRGRVPGSGESWMDHGDAAIAALKAAAQ